MKLFPKMFVILRGGAGKDISSGPLSDRVRHCAVKLITDKSVDTLLEVGVGEGLLAEAIIRGGSVKKIVGIDILKSQLIAARKKISGGGVFEGDRVRGGSFDTVMALGDTLPFRGETFDSVITINTLHNQPSWDEVSTLLGVVCSVVRPGGGVIFDIRNKRDPLISLAYRFSTVIDPTTKRLPVNAYSISKIRKRLAEMGFEIVKKVPVRYRFWPIPSAFVIEAVKVTK